MCNQSPYNLEGLMAHECGAEDRDGHIPPSSHAEKTLREAGWQPMVNSDQDKLVGISLSFVSPQSTHDRIGKTRWVSVS